MSLALAWKADDDDELWKTLPRVLVLPLAEEPWASPLLQLWQTPPRRLLLLLVTHPMMPAACYCYYYYYYYRRRRQ